MDNDLEARDKLTVWGSPHSLYTGKLRSYLVKKGLPFDEWCPSHPRYREVIRPLIRHKVSPVVETTDGRVLQDTTDIVEYLELAHPEPALIPTTPLQRTIAWLIDAFASEGMLQVAMHYRWSYREQQEHFLQAEFGRVMHVGPDRDARLTNGKRFMAYFNDLLPVLGIVPDTIPAIEAAYLDLLDVLDVHFQHHPYLLGGRPSLADVGLMAPMYAHLGRDPVPSSLMKNRAPNVYRWTERMNLAHRLEGEFWDSDPEWTSSDTIPATLEPVLQLIFRDWTAEMQATAARYNAWVEERPEAPAGHPVARHEERRVHPSLGAIEYDLRGRTVRRASAPHALWHFDRAAGLARGLDGSAADRFGSLLQRTGGEDLFSIRLARPMKRQDYLLVLA